MPSRPTRCCAPPPGAISTPLPSFSNPRSICCISQAAGKQGKSLKVWAQSIPAHGIHKSSTFHSKEAFAPFPKQQVNKGRASGLGSEHPSTQTGTSSTCHRKTAKKLHPTKGGQQTKQKQLSVCRGSLPGLCSPRLYCEFSVVVRKANG